MEDADDKAVLEAGEYALSGAGSYGDVPEKRRKAKYHYDRVDRYGLLRSPDGIGFHTKEALFEIGRAHV